jgi:hypothetical protein
MPLGFFFGQFCEVNRTQEDLAKFGYISTRRVGKIGFLP